MSVPEPPFLRSIFHPTDLGEASEVAFAHALAIALVRGASLAILHAGGGSQDSWRRLPAVRRTLERWKLIEPGSPRSAVFDELSVAVSKIERRENALKACRDYLAQRDADLIVLATERRSGPARWLQPSTAEAIARNSTAMTLFVPAGCRPIVRAEDGAITLRRILVPIAATPWPQTALFRAARTAEALGDPPVELTLLHVGETMPSHGALPDCDAGAWREILSRGDVIDEIVRHSADADLVVMPTDGRDVFVDFFRGSHTERVVRRIDCPLLAVPSV